ncbi:DNA polymerase III subunit gamma/tau [Mycoplasma procyoni]|uniref:DNA polymerase III subunit gamma/tau n=1 Tax=Mycoplasma procyoni TaxID=568784 RepID=UPI00197BC47D|nr:DNA polymerase III subunit gamma/tau [Mycoplasma procyoni]MBN3534591.1 DNA polymerase III subunit gamma/tau [Mycoplasma procyoni]
MENKNYKALYRTYRPQIFDEVRGQKFIIQTLKNIITSNKISHAYLFSGPRGTGKTSVAKIFANTINCPHSEDILKPCDYCIQNANNSLDIIEMDAASNNGVEEIRELRDKIQNRPVASKYKIYIIDEVHMLTKSAFNALLKTLEEPPKHAIFILATTDPYKIPLTILSRLQKFNFSKISDSVILEQLKFVAIKEGINFEQNALKQIVALADGGMRDALSIFEQISIYSQQNITEDSVEKVFGIVSKTKLIDLLNKLNQNLSSEVFALVKEFEKTGNDINSIVLNLISILRDYLVYKKTKNADLINFITVNQAQMIEINPKKALKYIDILFDTSQSLNSSHNSIQTLEICFIKILYESTQREIEVAPINKNTEINTVIEVPKQSAHVEEIKEVKEALESLSKQNQVDDHFSFNQKSYEKETPIKPEPIVEKPQEQQPKQEDNKLHDLDVLFSEAKVFEYKQNPEFVKSSLKEIEPPKVENTQIHSVFEQNVFDSSQTQYLEKDSNPSIFSSEMFQTQSIPLDPISEEPSMFSQNFESLSNTDIISRSQELILNQNEIVGSKEITTEIVITQEFDAQPKITNTILLDNTQEQIQETQKIENTENSVILETQNNNYQATNEYDKAIEKPEQRIKGEVFADLSIDDEEKEIIEEKPKPPAFLFEETKEIPIQGMEDVSLTAEISLAIPEDSLSVNETINLFSLAQKSRKKKDIIERRKVELSSDNLKLFMETNPEYKDYISELLRVKIITSLEDFILVSADDANVEAIWKINSFKNSLLFRELMRSIFGKEIHFFAISKSLFFESKMKWERILQTKTVPDPTPLPVLTEKTKQELEEEKVMSIFGSKFIKD